MKKAGKVLLLIIAFYLIVCGLLYFFQERIIFFPESLQKDYEFSFDSPYEEIYVNTYDSTMLHAILFKADSSKQVIFYLHGNAGSLRRWGTIAETYTGLGYDVFMLDYRGYGKSEGRIISEDQFYQDIQSAYDTIRARYQENEIIILGYSIGSGPAAKLASENNPKLLILQAPYYSLIDMMETYYPIFPTSILNYNFETYKYLKNVEAPVVIFHGDADEVIYHGSSLKLQGSFKEADTLITLKGQRHNGMTNNPQYIEAFKEVMKNIVN